MFKKQGYLYSEDWEKEDINLFVDTLINLMLENKVEEVISIIKCHDFPYQKINSYCNFCNYYYNYKYEHNELLKSLMQTGIIFHSKIRNDLNLNESLYQFILDNHISSSITSYDNKLHASKNPEFKELVIFEYFLNESYYSFSLKNIKQNHPYPKIFPVIIKELLNNMKMSNNSSYFSLMYNDRGSILNSYSTFHCLINLTQNSSFHPYLKEIYDFFELNEFILKYPELHASSIFSHIPFKERFLSISENKYNKKLYEFKFCLYASNSLNFFDHYFSEEVKNTIYNPEIFCISLLKDNYLMFVDFNDIKNQLMFWTNLVKNKLNIEIFPTYIKILFDSYCNKSKLNVPNFSVTNNYLISITNYLKNDIRIADIICKDHGYDILPEHIYEGKDMRKELRDSVISVFTDYHYNSIKDILTNDNQVEYNQNLEIKPTKKKRL